jgi:hypothetical protein
MGIDITALQKIVAAGRVKTVHFTYRHVPIEFNGMSLSDDDDCLSWGFQIEHVPSHLVDLIFLRDLKEAAEKLGENVQIYISPRVGRAIHALLRSEGFEHWVDYGEDEGYWWPSSPVLQYGSS